MPNSTLFACCVNRLPRRYPGRNIPQQDFCIPAFRSLEEIDGGNVIHPFAELVRLSLTLYLGVGGAGPLVEQLIGFLDDLFVIRVARSLKEGDYLFIVQPFYKPRLGNRPVSAAFDDLFEYPAQILPTLFREWQSVDRLFDCRGSHLLQPSPNLHAQGVGLGWNLVDQKQPCFALIEWHHLLLVTTWGGG